MAWHFRESVLSCTTLGLEPWHCNFIENPLHKAFWLWFLSIPVVYCTWMLRGQRNTCLHPLPERYGLDICTLHFYSQCWWCKIWAYSTVTFSKLLQLSVKVERLKYKCLFLTHEAHYESGSFRKTVSNCDHVAICLAVVCFQWLWRGKCASITAAGCIQACLPQALSHSEPVYCSSLTFYFGGWPCHSFTDNCFLTMFFFPLPLKGELPTFSPEC